jgi:hypothetical protein
MNISAVDENGQAVVWWFAYKISRLAKDVSSPSIIGYEYV